VTDCFVRGRTAIFRRELKDVKDFGGFSIKQSLIEKLPNYVDKILFLYNTGYKIRRFLMTRDEATHRCSPCRKGSEHHFKLQFSDMVELRGREKVKL